MVSISSGDQRVEVAVLASGSTGNSIYVATDQTRILIDSGLPVAYITNTLKSLGVNPKELSAVFVTHEHRDHASGVGPLSRRLDLPVYATEPTWGMLDQIVGNVRLRNRRAIVKHEGVDVGDLHVEAFSVSHDSQDPVGYVIYHGDIKIGIVTDTGVPTLESIEALRGSDLIVLEANHDLEMLVKGPYPWELKTRIMGAKGHLSNSDAAACLADHLVTSDTSMVVLAHISLENNTPELAVSTVSERLKARGIRPGVDLTVEPTRQLRPTGVFVVEKSLSFRKA